MRLMLIVIVGKPASGKTTAVETLGELGFSTASTGDVIRDEIKRRGWKYNKKNDAKIGNWFHRGNRESLVVKRLLKKTKGDKIALEGLRDPRQLKELKKQTGEEPVIVAVKADFEERVRRVKERERFEAETKKYLKQREKRELSQGEGELINKADYVIDNTNLTIEEFRDKIKSLGRKIMKK